MKVDVISDPHVFQSLQEETLLQLLLSEESNEVLLLKVKSKKRDNESSLFGLLYWTTSYFNKFQTFLQVNALYSIIDNLIEVFDLSVCVDGTLILDLVPVFIMNIVKNHIVSICEMENSHQVIDKELLN